MAIELGDLDLCRRAVEGGANTDLGYEVCQWCTPLLYLLQRAKGQATSLKIAEYLILQGAIVAGSTCGLSVFKGYTAFHYAATLNDVRLLRVLLERYPVDILMANASLHPIHLAVASGKFECVKLIIEHSKRHSRPRNVIPLHQDSHLLYSTQELLQLSVGYYSSDDL